MGITLKYGNPAVDIAAGFAVGQNRAQDKRRREVLRIMEQERSMRYDTARRMSTPTGRPASRRCSNSPKAKGCNHATAESRAPGRPSEPT